MMTGCRRANAAPRLPTAISRGGKGGRTYSLVSPEMAAAAAIVGILLM